MSESSNADDLTPWLVAEKKTPRLHRVRLAMLTGKVWLIAIGIGILMFIASVGFDVLLLRQRETPAAIVVSNGLVGVLAALLVYTLLAYGRRQRRLMLQRMEALQEVNHHIRNALQALSFTAGTLQGTREGATVKEAIQRIRWALAEVLPKVEPAYEPFEGSARDAQRDLGPDLGSK